MDPRELYQDIILDHGRHPRNHRALAHPSCAISTASASLMTEILKGKTLAEAAALFKQFHASVTGEDAVAPEGLEDEMDRLAPLAGVRAYPARVKCATLAWHAFEAALKSGAVGTTVKTE